MYTYAPYLPAHLIPDSVTQLRISRDYKKWLQKAGLQGQFSRLMFTYNSAQLIKCHADNLLYLLNGNTFTLLGEYMATKGPVNPQAFYNYYHYRGISVPLLDIGIFNTLVSCIECSDNLSQVVDKCHLVVFNATDEAMILKFNPQRYLQLFSSSGVRYYSTASNPTVPWVLTGSIEKAIEVAIKAMELKTLILHYINSYKITALI